MDFSATVLDELALVGDSVHLSDESFAALVERVFHGITDHSKRDIAILCENDVLKHIDKAVLKQAYGGLVTLVTEVAKHDMEVESLGSLLEECKFSAERIAVFIKVFMQNKPKLQILLDGVGNQPPHIVDVDWRLDYYIKNNHLDKMNEPVYLVTLKTEEPGRLGLQEVQLSCSLEQLQDFVGKLKDATKCLEKMGQL